MNLSFRQMEYICAIADTGSYCAAAKKLYVTQPTLSIAVKNIEKSLGTPLFIRKKSEVVPTDEGTIVLTYARKILLLQKEMERKLYRQQMAHIKRIRIGIYSILNTVIIPPLLVRFKEKKTGAFHLNRLLFLTRRTNRSDSMKLYAPIA